MTRVILWVAVSSRPQASDDKESLPAQERDLRALAEQNQWDIIDVLMVPGHSRRYIDIHALAADAMRQGIDAFYKLLEHFERRDFDGLLVRDADRFARTQSLHAYIVESIIDCGAFIYSLADGLVDRNNFRMFIAMSGYRAAGAIDALVKGYDMAMKARPARGLPAHSQVIWSHKIIRDELGKPIRVEVDESKRRLFDDLATLILEGVSWFDLEQELYRRFGHTHEKGYPFPHNFFYKRVYHPQWWGHVARHFRSEEYPNGHRSDLWVLDPNEPLPEGVHIWRNVFPPVWDGDVAELVKAELRRRKMTIRGKARSRHTYRFSGLFICGGCGYHMKYTHDGRKWYALKCESRYWADHIRPKCPQTKTLNQNKAQEYVDAFLRKLFAAKNIEPFFNDQPDTSLSERHVEQVKAEIKDTSEQAERLLNLMLRLEANSPLEAVYDKQMNGLEEKLEILHAELERLERQSLDTEAQERRNALERIRVNYDKFWDDPDHVINQQLHAVMGKRRFVVAAGEVKGIGTPRGKR